ncbi:hypothetical protein LXL04_033955 [Taraxacum kok-saghyz]
MKESLDLEGEEKNAADPLSGNIDYCPVSWNQHGTETLKRYITEDKKPWTDGEYPLNKFSTLRVLNMNLLLLQWISASNASRQSIFAITQMGYPRDAPATVLFGEWFRFGESSDRYPHNDALTTYFRSMEHVHLLLLTTQHLNGQHSARVSKSENSSDLVAYNDIHGNDTEYMFTNNNLLPQFQNTISATPSISEQGDDYKPTTWSGGLSLKLSPPKRRKGRRGRQRRRLREGVRGGCRPEKGRGREQRSDIDEAVVTMKVFLWRGGCVASSEGIREGVGIGEACVEKESRAIRVISKLNPRARGIEEACVQRIVRRRASVQRKGSYRGNVLNPG